MEFFPIFLFGTPLVFFFLALWADFAFGATTMRLGCCWPGPAHSAFGRPSPVQSRRRYCLPPAPGGGFYFFVRPKQVSPREIKKRSPLPAPAVRNHQRGGGHSLSSPAACSSSAHPTPTPILVGWRVLKIRRPWFRSSDHSLPLCGQNEGRPVNCVPY
ncbi:hypothetical protein VPH35_124757 [Triticum aestivum]